MPDMDFLMTPPKPDGYHPMLPQTQQSDSPLQASSPCQSDTAQSSLQGESSPTERRQQAITQAMQVQDAVRAKLCVFRGSNLTSLQSADHNDLVTGKMRGPQELAREGCKTPRTPIKIHEVPSACRKRTEVLLDDTQHIEWHKTLRQPVDYGASLSLRPWQPALTLPSEPQLATARRSSSRRSSSRGSSVGRPCSEPPDDCNRSDEVTQTPTRAPHSERHSRTTVPREPYLATRTRSLSRSRATSSSRLDNVTNARSLSRNRTAPGFMMDNSTNARSLSRSRNASSSRLDKDTNSNVTAANVHASESCSTVCARRVAHSPGPASRQSLHASESCSTVCARRVAHSPGSASRQRLRVRSRSVDENCAQHASDSRRSTDPGPVGFALLDEQKETGMLIGDKHITASPPHHRIARGNLFANGVSGDDKPLRTSNVAESQAQLAREHILQKVREAHATKKERLCIFR